MIIYLDYNATTPVAEPVVAAMLPYLREHHGNPSSGHRLGAVTRRAVEDARRQVAALLGAAPEEIIFTSGGSESNNHSIKGVADRLKGRGNHIITSAVEHPAVLRPCDHLEQRGFRITRVGVDGTGRVDPDEVRKAITPDTILVTVMHANNEVGTIQPIREIAAIAREAGVWMHTDAAQSVGKIPVKVDALGVDFLTIAGHKFHAPPGVGALYVRSGIEIEPLIHGAGHERGRRAGTEAVPNIVGLGAAAEFVGTDGDDGTVRRLRDRLHTLLAEGVDDSVVLNGHPELRLPNTLSVGFRGIIGAELLARLEDFCASAGAACHATTHEPSAVLKAMAVPRDVALGTVRLSLGRPTTEAEVTQAADRIVKTVRKMS